MIIRDKHGPAQAYEVMGDLTSQGVQERYELDHHTLFSVDAWNFTFDGKFQQEAKTIDISIASKDIVPIDSLDCYPLKYASHRTKELLAQRGTGFWQCRRRHLVSYNAHGGLETHVRIHPSFLLWKKD